MALSKSMLTSMKLEPDQIEAILSGHTDSLTGIQEERDKYKAEAEKNRKAAEKYEAIKTELDELKKETAGGEDWRTKYEAEKEAFEAYKGEQVAKETKQAKVKAYKDLLRQADIPEKRWDAIIKITNIDEIVTNKDGALRDSEKLLDGIKEEWAEFITTTETEGARTETPPLNSGGKKEYKTKADIMAIQDRDARRAAIKENPQLFINQ